MSFNISSPSTQSRSLPKQNYQTIDTEYGNNAQSMYQSIKSHQMMSTILDTIDQKSSDPQDLKRSLNKFDKQFLNMFSSNVSRNQQHTQKPLFFTQKLQNNYFPEISSPNQMQSIQSSLQATKPQRLLQQSTHKLKIPKPNTLTDQFMKGLLGSQQQLIEQYDRTVNPIKYQQQFRQQSKLNAKQMFRQVPACDTMNCFVDPLLMIDKSKAFYDQQYYTYLKTNMKYISEMSLKSSKNNNQKQKNNLSNTFKAQIKNQFHQKTQPNNNKPFNAFEFIQHSNQLLVKQQPINQSSSFNNQSSPQKIVKKIKQTGGIQNTIQKMQLSLKKNQLKHLKINQYLNKKSSMIDQHKQKKLSMERNYSSNETMHATINSNANNTQINQSNKVATNKSSNQQKIFNKINRQNQIINRNAFRQSNNTINPPNNPSFFNHQNHLDNNNKNNKNWREKSQSLRKHIEKSLDNKLHIN